MRWRLFVSFWLYPMLAAGLLVSLAAAGFAVSALSMLGWAFLGLLVWSLLEYLMHRFLFHWTPENRAIRRFLASLHLRHHGAPREPGHILVRPQYSLPLSGLLLVVWSLLLGWVPAVALMVGTWSGFLYYEAVHYRIHMSKKSAGLLGLQRKSHFYHHFVDDEHCFGVTSPLWDWILGTYRRLEV